MDVLPNNLLWIRSWQHFNIFNTFSKATLIYRL